jgi:hypothetical protein
VRRCDGAEAQSESRLACILTKVDIPILLDFFSSSFFSWMQYLSALSIYEEI